MSKFIYFFKINLFLLLICSQPIEGKISEAFKFIKAEELLAKNEIKNFEQFSLKDKALPEWMLTNIREETSKFERFSLHELEFFFNNEHSNLLYHFQIRNKKLFIRSNQNGKPFPIEHISAISKLMEQPEFSIQNGDFLLSTADWCDTQTNIPRLCFSKSFESNSILIPDWFSLGNDRTPLMNKIDRACKKTPWESKLNIGFWIGAPNNRFLESDELWKSKSPRASLIFFSLEHPNLLWARFCPFADDARFCKDMIASRALISSKHIEPSSSCKYKYQIDVDGWSCGFHRCQWILRSNCVPIKQVSPYFQWYYKGLKPYEHYVPYKADCSDLKAVIEWLKCHDDQAKMIAQQGNQFFHKYLNLNMIYLYLYHVLCEYNQLNKDV